MSGPEIAVVVPTYRRSALLGRMVEALEAQTLDADRFEVLVVDNGSDDDTAAVLAGLAARTSLRLRPLRIDVNRGPAGARNAGWRATTAPLVAFTDDDCVPEPGWLEAGLEAMAATERLGVVQGRTLKPEGDYPFTNWTAYREVLGPTPWFEGCNLFFRRDALAATGGFDESVEFGGEDTVAGWAVVAGGWERGFADGAVVRHDLSERGVGWHVWMGWKEGELLRVTARFPAMRRELWRPWAVRPWNVAFAVGVVGTVVGLWRRPVLLLWLPWVVMRRHPLGTPHWLRYLGEKWAVDAAVFAGMKVGAVRHRQLVL